jgi:hypothetical protein
MTPRLVDGYIEITFNRRLPDCTPLTYQIQQSSDLQTWTPFSSTEISAAPSNRPGFETVTLRATSPTGLQASLFVRLAVNSP